MHVHQKKPSTNMLILLSTLWLLMSPIMSQTEQPKYHVIKTYSAFEIRQYKPMILARFSARGPREKALNRGFKALADYIFGNNQSSTKIAMTAPVMQQQQNQQWSIYFVMPSHYNLGTLPKPNNQKVVLQQQPTRQFAVLRFSGFISSRNIDRHTKDLRIQLKKHGIQTKFSPIYAFFNPPWTLPFFRRNEIMFEVQ